MICVFGAGGMLGKAILHSLATFGGPSLFCPGKEEVDVSNQISVFRYLKEKKPKFVINCAAIRSADICESLKHQSFSVNALGPKYIAQACESIKAKFIQISTDHVFDGRLIGDSYKEHNACNPIQYYGYSKLEGENNAISHGGIVARVQWIYGRSRSNYVDWMIAVIGSRRRGLVKEQYGSPCSVAFVSNILLMFMLRAKSGDIYHIAHDDYAERLDVARYVCDYFGFRMEDFFSRNEEENKLVQVPVNAFLDNSKVRDLLGFSTLGSWRQDLKNYLETNYIDSSYFNQQRALSKVLTI